MNTMNEKKGLWFHKIFKNLTVLWFKICSQILSVFMNFQKLFSNTKCFHEFKNVHNLKNVYKFNDFSWIKKYGLHWKSKGKIRKNQRNPVKEDLKRKTGEIKNGLGNVLEPFQKLVEKKDINSRVGWPSTAHEGHAFVSYLPTYVRNKIDLDGCYC